MKVFQLTLQGYDPETTETDDLIKWVKVTDAETIDQWLQETGLRDFVLEVDDNPSDEYDFDDGVDVKLLVQDGDIHEDWGDSGSVQFWKNQVEENYLKPCMMLLTITYSPSHELPYAVEGHNSALKDVCRAETRMGLLAEISKKLNVFGKQVETDRCEQCFAPLEAEDIDGGRCTHCGTMLVSKPIDLIGQSEPRAVLTVEGGLVQAMFTNYPGLSVTIVDYDQEGVTKDELAEDGCVFECPDGNFARAYEETPLPIEPEIWPGELLAGIAHVYEPMQKEDVQNLG